MAKTYRTYSTEFKQQVIAEIDAGSISLSEAARQHEISRSLVERWRVQIHGGTLPERPTAKERQLEKELEKAQAKIGQLTLMIDMLKKIQKPSVSMKESKGSVVTGESWASPSAKDAK